MIWGNRRSDSPIPFRDLEVLYMGATVAEICWMGVQGDARERKEKWARNSLVITRGWVTGLWQGRVGRAWAAGHVNVTMYRECATHATKLPLKGQGCCKVRLVGQSYRSQQRDDVSRRRHASNEAPVEGVT